MGSRFFDRPRLINKRMNEITERQLEELSQIYHRDGRRFLERAARELVETDEEAEELIREVRKR